MTCWTESQPNLLPYDMVLDIVYLLSFQAILLLLLLLSMMSGPTLLGGMMPLGSSQSQSKNDVTVCMCH